MAFELLTKTGKKIHTQMLANVAVAGGQAHAPGQGQQLAPNQSITIVYGGDAKISARGQ